MNLQNLHGEVFRPRATFPVVWIAINMTGFHLGKCGKCTSLVAPCLDQPNTPHSNPISQENVVFFEVDFVRIRTM